ncbi:MAG: antibiotic biosynthesis monooxygenase [Methylococcaceae bacterium]|jgi:heme-degrading monooxygenase HmoA
MVLEIAILNIKSGQTAAFEQAFQQASAIIAAANGYISHQLQRCIENPSQYLLIVYWRTLEDHTQGFRGSQQYQTWRALLHHFYEPMPSVEHYNLVMQNTGSPSAQ